MKKILLVFVSASAMDSVVMGSDLSYEDMMEDRKLRTSKAGGSR